MSERKTIQIDLNTHNLLVKHCAKNQYYVGGWVAKIIKEAILGKPNSKTKKPKQ